jgi:hypothetical protein
MSAVKVGQTWGVNDVTVEITGPVSEYPNGPGYPVRVLNGEWPWDYLLEDMMVHWDLISDAPAVAEPAHVCEECDENLVTDGPEDHASWCSKSTRRTSRIAADGYGYRNGVFGRYASAAPPVAERVTPKRVCVDCDTAPLTGELPMRITWGQPPRPICDDCYLKRERGAVAWTNLVNAPAPEPLPAGTWRAPDLLARPWLYRGRGR